MKHNYLIYIDIHQIAYIFRIIHPIPIGVLLSIADKDTAILRPDPLYRHTPPAVLREEYL